MELLPHKSNLLTKIQTNYGDQASFFQQFYDEQYLPWHQQNMDLTETTKEALTQRVHWLSSYLNVVDSINTTNCPDGKTPKWITAQSKFRPTVLEEFMFYLLKDCPALHKLGLTFTNKAVFVGMSINHQGSLVIKKKDVDCAIVKEDTLSFSTGSVPVMVPLVAIEIKTYVDKTMWGEAQFTAQAIKRGNPSSYVYLMAETNSVALEELLPNSPVDELFILRSHTGSAIDTATVCNLYEEINMVFTRVATQQLHQPPGKMLHPE